MRRHWSVFAPTQHHFHYTCNLVLHKAFWGTQSSFFNGGKKPMHHYRDIDHPIVVLHFADHLPLFLNTLNSENMSWHHTRQCIESVARRQFFFCTWAGPCAKWPTRLITQRCASFSVLFHQSHTSPSLFHPLLIFFQWIYIHSKTLQGCIHLVPVANSSF